MKVYGVFTQLLDELVRYSKKNDTAKATIKDFSNLQKLEDKINNCYSRNYYTYGEYRILIDTCIQVKSTMREVIRVNNEVKSLGRQIRLNRRTAWGEDMSKFIKTIDGYYINRDYIFKIMINGTDEKSTIIAETTTGNRIDLVRGTRKLCENAIESIIEWGIEYAQPEKSIRRIKNKYESCIDNG